MSYIEQAVVQRWVWDDNLISYDANGKELYNKVDE